MHQGLEHYQDRRGKWRWRLVSENNRIVAASTQGYVNHTDCVDNARLVMELLFKYLDHEQ